MLCCMSMQCGQKTKPGLSGLACPTVCIFKKIMPYIKLKKILGSMHLTVLLTFFHKLAQKNNLCVLFFSF